jgi:hypothetical protein
VQKIIEISAMERHPVQSRVLQSSLVSPILFAIYTSGRNTWVEQYPLEAERLSIGDDISWFAIGGNVIHVISILERCEAKSIGWASR